MRPTEGQKSEIRRYISTGKTRLLEKNYEGAIEAFTSALRLDPSNSRAKSGKATALIGPYIDNEVQKLAQVVEARAPEANFREALELDPNMAEALCARGEAIVLAGRENKVDALYALASKFFNAVLADHTVLTNSSTKFRKIKLRAYLGRGEVYLKLAQPSQALAAFVDASTFGSASSAVKRGRLRVALLLGDKMNDNEVLRDDFPIKIAELVQAFVARGKQHLERGNLEKAHADLAKASTLSAANENIEANNLIVQRASHQLAEAFVRRGNELLAKEEFEAAHNAFGMALTLDPNDSAAGRGQERVTGEKENAIQLAVKHVNDFFKVGNDEKALELFDFALSLDPNHAALQAMAFIANGKRLLAELYEIAAGTFVLKNSDENYCNERRERAQDEFVKALQINPEMADMLCSCGNEIIAAMARTDWGSAPQIASTFFEAVLTCYPENIDAKHGKASALMCDGMNLFQHARESSSTPGKIDQYYKTSNILRKESGKLALERFSTALILAPEEATRLCGFGEEMFKHLDKCWEKENKSYVAPLAVMVFSAVLGSKAVSDANVILRATEGRDKAFLYLSKFYGRYTAKFNKFFGVNSEEEVLEKIRELTSLQDSLKDSNSEPSETSGEFNSPSAFVQSLDGYGLQNTFESEKEPDAPSCEAPRVESSNYQPEFFSGVPYYRNHYSELENRLDGLQVPEYNLADENEGEGEVDERESELVYL